MNNTLVPHQWVRILRRTFAKVMRFLHTFPQSKNPSVKRFRVAIRSVMVLVLGTALVFGTVVFGTVMWASTVHIPPFGQLQNRYVGESTKLYDRSGSVLLYDTEGSMRRTILSREEISPYLLDATVATEDDSFYTHEGIRPDAIMRALLINMKSMSLAQGGSTITQQVIKNTLLTKDKSIVRKLKEWVLALRIERKYSKEEILVTYLNETPYGGTLYGVEEASRAYFDTSAKDITLSQAAYLAALPKAPTYFSPWGTHFDKLQERHNMVLASMLSHDMITEDEYADALAQKVVFNERGTETIKAPHFVFFVLDELEKKFGKEEVYGGGLQVVTTLDWELQQESETIIRTGALQNEKKFRASNAGLVAIDPRSGQILAMVGSRDYFDDSVDGQVNVTLAHRQPGSAFKPFVYAAAFKKGYSPDTILFDLKTQFSTACSESNFSNEFPCYSPENYDEKYRGPMTLRDALAQSVNIVSVKALYLSGINEVISLARSFGISTLTDEKRYGLTLVLGGGEVTLLEMTSAYGAFANEGTWYESTPFLSIRTPKGKVLEEYKGIPESVLDPKIAQTINDVLSDNEARTPAFGSNSPLYFGDTLVANKTGTTNDYRDAWVIGYTSTIVVGTWAGNNDNTPMEKSVSAFILAPMWHQAMEKAIARFPFPPLRVVRNHEITTPSTSTSTQPAKSTLFDPANGIHEIFYWMNKGSGDTEDTYKDPQIARWGYPVLLWAMGQAPTLAASAPVYSSPIALGVGGPDGVPLQMAITSPINGSYVRPNNPITIAISHSEMNSVLNVSYYFNGVFVGSRNEPPFTLSVTAGGEGVVQIRAVAESPLGDSEATTLVTFNEDSTLSQVSQ